MPIPERVTTGRFTIGSVLGESVLEALLELPDFISVQNRFDPRDSVTDAHDAVPVGVEFLDASCLHLGGEPEPLDLAAFKAGLLDRPHVGHPASVQPLSEPLELRPVVAVGSRDTRVGEHLDRQAGPLVGGVLASPSLLKIDAFVGAVRARA
jgi:hypothetical protein